MARNAERRARALMLLATGRPPAEIIAELGISERTLRYWKADPGFREELGRIQRDILDRACAKVAEARAQLADGLSAANAALKELLKADSVMAKLGAVRTYWEYCSKIPDAEQQRRLDELERLLNGARPPAADEPDDPSEAPPPWRTPEPSTD